LREFPFLETTSGKREWLRRCVSVIVGDAEWFLEDAERSSRRCQVFALARHVTNTVDPRYKILLQHYELPPLNPATNKKIDLQKILIGFGGGKEGVLMASGPKW
jgi:hypothetical protein